MKKVLSEIDLFDCSNVRVDDGANAYAFFCQSKPLRVDQNLLEKLKNVFDNVGPRNVRLCLHEDSDSNFHDMIILERKSRHYRPHCHLEKGESFHIIEGELGVFTFNDTGEVIDCCILTKNNIRIYKVKPNMFHAVLPLSDYVIYHETKPGPFLGKKDSIYPEWEPNVNSKNEKLNYLKKLKKALNI